MADSVSERPVTWHQLGLVAVAAFYLYVAFHPKKEESEDGLGDQ